MTDTFFKLKGTVTEIGTQQELLQHFDRSRDLRNVLYRPDELAWEPSKEASARRLRFVDVAFNNVSFSKTTIRGAQFHDCVFEDCLFIGSILTDCEFHGCVFVRCNTHKITIERCYLDPSSFADALDPKKHQNIGVHLYNELLRASDSRQHYSYWATADAQYRRWRRFTVVRDIRTTASELWKNGLLQSRTRALRRKLRRQIQEWVPNYLHDMVTGYGHAPLSFVGWTLLMLLVLVVVNMSRADDLGMTPLIFDTARDIGQSAFAAVSESVYYTIGTLTSIGFSPLFPTTPVGRLIVAAEALVGLLWLGTLASIVVKKVVR